MEWMQRREDLRERGEKKGKKVYTYMHIHRVDIEGVTEGRKTEGRKHGRTEGRVAECKEGRTLAISFSAWRRQRSEAYLHMWKGGECIYVLFMS